MDYMHPGLVLLRQPNDLAIDLNHHRAFDGFMPQHPPQHAAITGADDEHILRRTMRQQRYVRVEPSQKFECMDIQTPVLIWRVLQSVMWLEPDCETEIATMSPNTLAAATPSDASNSPIRKKSVKFTFTAFEFHPSRIPASTKPASAATLAVVNPFCTYFPYSSPRVFVYVSSAITRIAVNCAVESERA